MNLNDHSMTVKDSTVNTDSITITLNTKRLLILILSLQISIWSIYGIQSLLGFKIPLLSQFLPFVYLTFVPGFLLMGILKFENLNTTEFIIYSIGSSLALTMSTGLAGNYLLHWLGISQPLSFLHILMTMTIFIIILSTIAYIRNPDFSKGYHIDMGDYISLSTLFLCTIPFLTILGVYAANVYGNSYLIFFTISLIIAVPLLVAFDKIPRKLYPLAIFVVSISLLYHISLVSNFIYGRDAFYEYYVSTLTLKNLYWNANLAYELNSLMSITILPTIYHELCNVSLAYIFKMFYPFFFALVPLTLYELFRKQVTSKKSFLACFFMVSIISFYAEMPQLLRQEMGEIFFVLSLLLLMDSKLDETKKYFLLVLFLVAITFSHYSMAYFYLFIIVFTTIIQKIVKSNVMGTFHQKLKDGKFKRLNNFLPLEKLGKPSEVYIKYSFVALVVVFIICWYMFVSQGTTFKDLVAVIKSIFENLIYDFFNINSSQAVTVAATNSQTYISLKVVAVLNLLATFFISLGLFYTLFRDKKENMGNFIPEYLILSIINFFLWVLAVVIPYISSILTANRLYHITLLTLAPFVIVGGIKFFNFFRINEAKALKLLSLCLVVFYVFNVGIVGFLIGEKTSMGLDSGSDFPKANEAELNGARWLAFYKIADLQSFGDVYRMPILGAFDWDKSDAFPKNLTWIGENYIYLGTLNTETGRALVDGGRFSGGRYMDIRSLIQNKDKIYDNGKSTIYR